MSRYNNPMKNFFFILSIFIWTNAFSQIEKYKGIWITPDQEILDIRDTGDYGSLSNTLLEEKDLKLYFNGDTLSFQFKYTSSATDYKVYYIDKYDLKIIKSNDSSIILKPISKFSKIFFQNKEELIFTKQAFTIDTSIKFEKIILHTSGCFGRCPVYHLEIDSSKSAKLYAQTVYLKGIHFRFDTAKQGYFKGKISDSNFQRLMNDLQTCNLPTLRMSDNQCCDGVVYTLIIYFNGQRKYYKTMEPPKIAEDLIWNLKEIYKKEKLIKTSEKFDFEE